jgi:hypothetical protein
MRKRSEVFLLDKCESGNAVNVWQRAALRAYILSRVIAGENLRRLELYVLRSASATERSAPT